MEKLCKSELCTGCGACSAACAAGCIRMEADSEGFLHPFVQEEKCIGCNRCRQACPILTPLSIPAENTTAYAAINHDGDIRLDSTSGGVFSILCQWILARSGVVFGAAYNHDFHVVHCRVDSVKDLHKLRGAKYAQSHLGNTFHQVQTCLKNDQYVLFSGTPCQIGGLISFLGRSYDKLFLVDLICHGVPSPEVWEHYIQYRSQQDAQDKAPCSINLRSKESGWPGYSIRFDYADGPFYSAPNSQDPYLRGFVGNLYLRPSCYDCHFKGSSRQSDFTLGDYWGVWDQLPELHDGKGTSIVLVHSEKARVLWAQLSQYMQTTAVDSQKALKDNPSALVSSAVNPMRADFFVRYRTEDFNTLIDELLPKKQAAQKKQSFLRGSVGKILRRSRRHKNNSI